MEYIREMLLRQRTALGRLMLGGGSAEEPETAAASPATERTSPAAPAPWETDGALSRTVQRDARRYDGGFPLYD